MGPGSYKHYDPMGKGVPVYSMSPLSKLDNRILPGKLSPGPGAYDAKLDQIKPKAQNSKLEFV